MKELISLLILGFIIDMVFGNKKLTEYGGKVLNYLKLFNTEDLMRLYKRGIKEKNKAV